jgi:hypothetical protein
MMLDPKTNHMYDVSDSDSVSVVRKEYSCQLTLITLHFYPYSDVLPVKGKKDAMKTYGGVNV